jgi:hypothetical protein
MEEHREFRFHRQQTTFDVSLAFIVVDGTRCLFTLLACLRGFATG